MTSAPILPLAGWADAQLRAMAALTGSPAIAALTGAALLGERAALNGFRIPARQSAGGGCRLFDTRDGAIALTLARPDDRALLPALFGDDMLDPDDDKAIVTRLLGRSAAEIVTQGRLLGLAIAALDERPVSPVCQITATGEAKAPARSPLVIDLSALWAGPLAAHLLGVAGAEVIKVESHNRPDRMRQGDPALFSRLNQYKANITLDLRTAADREALIALIRRADMVIEAARPRALLQLGIDADQIVRETPGLVWMTITGHGIAGEAANWIGFGDDCSVAGGLSAALREAGGSIGFGGDACADPLTGLYTARAAVEQYATGRAARMVVSMSSVIAEAVATENPDTLKQWGAAAGQPFPAVPVRAAGPVAALGADNEAWLAAC